LPKLRATPFPLGTEGEKESVDILEDKDKAFRDQFPVEAELLCIAYHIIVQTERGALENERQRTCRLLGSVDLGRQPGAVPGWNHDVLLVEESRKVGRIFGA